MSIKTAAAGAFMQTRRHFLLLPLLFASSRLLAEPAASTPLPQGMCPLNSGGESLLGTQWRLALVYGNPVPEGLDITMKVGENALEGFAGCNTYVANFKRVGHTGFMMTNIDKGREACPVLRLVEGAPTINVGDWEGNYLRTLRRAGSVQQQADGLHFFNRSGEPSVTFTAWDGATTEEPEAVETPAPAATS